MMVIVVIDFRSLGDPGNDVKPDAKIGSKVDE